MLTAKLNTKLLFTQEDKKNPKKEVKLGQFGCPSCYTTALDVSPKQIQNYTSLHSNTYNHKTQNTDILNVYLWDVLVLDAVL